MLYYIANKINNEFINSMANWQHLIAVAVANNFY